MNRVTLRRGSADDASLSPGPAQSDGTLPVWVSEAFANATGCSPAPRCRR